MAACNKCIYGVSSDQQEDMMVFHRNSLASDKQISHSLGITLENEAHSQISSSSIQI